MKQFKHKQKLYTSHSACQGKLLMLKSSPRSLSHRSRIDLPSNASASVCTWHPPRLLRCRPIHQSIPNCHLRFIPTLLCSIQTRQYTPQYSTYVDPNHTVSGTSHPRLANNLVRSFPAALFGVSRFRRDCPCPVCSLLARSFLRSFADSTKIRSSNIFLISRESPDEPVCCHRRCLVCVPLAHELCCMLIASSVSEVSPLIPKIHQSPSLVPSNILSK